MKEWPRNSLIQCPQSMMRDGSIWLPPAMKHQRRISTPPPLSPFVHTFHSNPKFSSSSLANRAKTNHDLSKAYTQLQNENVRPTAYINVATNHNPTDCDRKVSALSQQNAQLHAELLQNLRGGQAGIQHVLGRIRQLETAQEQLQEQVKSLVKRQKIGTGSIKTYFLR